MDNKTIFWQSYINLEKEIIDLSKYISFTDSNRKIENNNIVEEECDSQLYVYSAYICDLLVNCCIQIEAISKELYFENGGEKQRGDVTLYFDEDCIKLLDIKYDIGNKKVYVINNNFSFSQDINRVLKPLKNAHKRGERDWKKAYQAIKHDRYNNLYKGNVKNLIRAAAALYLLNIYYRNEVLIKPYSKIDKIDLSFGSQIFSIEKPQIHSQLWYENLTQKSASPYVVKYDESVENRIKKMQKDDSEKLVEYFNNQPEAVDEEFLKEMEKIINDKILVGYDIFNKLYVYRLKKIVEKVDGIQEKINKLLKTEEYNRYINVHKGESLEITNENIDAVIEKIATFCSFNLNMYLNPERWEVYATTSAICKIYIE